MILLSSFIFGLIFGSFLNVIIYRLKTPPGRGLSASLWKDRSHCPQCQIQLQWRDLFPLFSFIFLRGRCRYCHKKISWQYPIVELLSGLIWILIPLDKGELWGVLNFSYYIFIFSAFLVIAVYDFKWKIIPDRVVYPAIAIALIYNIFLPDKGELWGVLLTATAAFLFFFSIYFFSGGKAMGMGDAKLAILIGLFLSPVVALTAFTWAFVIGAIFGIILIALGKKTLKSQIAFGPFMAIGAAIAFFFSDIIINSFLIL